MVSIDASLTYGGDLMLTKEELQILAVAAGDDHGEYCLSREYNEPWGEQCAAMKHLEDLGFMKIKSGGRVPEPAMSVDQLSQMLVVRHSRKSRSRTTARAAHQMLGSTEPLPSLNNSVPLRGRADGY